MQGVALFEHLEDFEPSADDGRGDGVAEEIGARALAEHVNDLLRTCGEATDGTTEGLAERAGVQVDASVAVELLGYSSTRPPDDTCRVAFVDHDECVVLLR